ncbi:isoflavone reductase family protein-like protein CipA [Flagelloscypha sp. PMI_526]|nr:isoflavone reductase family protein-like protein CipA [Flagelloscypha sp. PMI_526]
MSVNKVIILGAGGNLGPTILAALQASKKFTITVLARPESKSVFPSDVTVIKSDYSLSSLQSAFSGQDVVISTVGAGGFAAQKTIIDAAAAAGVKRFFPSEFGSRVTDESVAFVPLFQGKKDVVDYLISQESKISWTALQTGAFFDWGIKVGFFGFDLANHKASVLDGGKAKFHSTNLSTVGKAIVALLSKPEAYEKSKNQYVRIASHEVSQADLLAGFERITGVKWEVTDTDSDPLVKTAREKLAEGDLAEGYTLLRVLLFGKVDLGTLGAALWNDDLGLEKEDLDADLKLILDGKSS